MAPRGLYASGKGSTAAGLTAAVVREKSGMMMLEAGTVVLADKGIACIDEFDKMRQEDRTALHEAMEQQTVSVAKGGINATLNARTAVLAAANPLDGQYDPYKTFNNQINIDTPLLTRFDLIFAIRDSPNTVQDEKLGTHILDMHETGQTNINVPLEFGLLKKYIGYAKNFEPKLTDDAKKKILDFYVATRQRPAVDEEGNQGITVTPRALEGLIRLSSAPDTAATVAKPDLKLCPEYLFESNPAIAVYFFIVKATLLSDILKIFPDLIPDFSSQFFNETTGQ